MVNFLPAILVGGPPHAGKSVLFYHLTQALRERHIPHHAIRACPDGDHNWFHEGNPETVTIIRESNKLPEWPPEFIQSVCQDLEHRCLPFLVDMGGNPRPSQECLFDLCTHSILLSRADRPDATSRWQHLMEEHNLIPLARLLSQREGASVITAYSLVLEGTLTGLERHDPDAGAGYLFNELVERIATFFSSADLHDQKATYLKQARTELVLDLGEALRAITKTSIRWEPEMLPSFLTSLPAQTPLSVYEAGPGWLYAALAAHSDPQPFYLFDPRLPFGWVQPVRVSLGEEPSAQVHIELQHHEEMTVLTIAFPNDRLEYFQPDPLFFPPVPEEKGLIIYGRAPHWLLTALVRLYKASRIPWMAPFYVPLNCAIISYSCVEQYQSGDRVLIPTS